MDGPMEGVKVIDLSEGYEGYCGMILAEFGASVVKVEPIEGDYIRQLGPPFIAGESAAFMGVNRGKRSVALAWKDKAEARQLLLRLIAQADVLLTTLYADEAEELKLTYEAVQEVNPGLIYCSFTPMGDIGPSANYRATDLEIQGMFGHWRYLGFPKFHKTAEAPLRLGVPVGALNGSVFAYQGITAALIYKRRTGKGQKVMVSEAGSLIAMRHIQFAAESEPDEYEGHNVGHLRPPFNGTQTKDKVIYWGFSGADDAVPKFLEAMGLGHLLKNPSFVGGGRLEMQGEVKTTIEAKFKDMPAEEVMDLIRKNGGAAVYFNTFEGVSKDPQALAMGMVAKFEHPRAGTVGTIGLPWGFSDSTPEVGTPPVLGQHTHEALKGIGLPEREIKRLSDAGLILQAKI